MKNGASAGRAFLEAQQQFLLDSGPHLDPFELKTIAQFSLLGDPSKTIVETPSLKSSENTIENRRKNLQLKGSSIQMMVICSKKTSSQVGNTTFTKSLKSLVVKNGFDQENKQQYHLQTIKKKVSSASKNIAMDSDAQFHVFQKSKKEHGMQKIQVMDVKEKDNTILGYKIYESK